MSDEELTATVAVHEAIVSEDQVEAEAEAVEPETEAAPETEEATEERRRESAKERRERDKASRQKLRDDLAAAQAKIAELTTAQSRIASEAQGLQRPKEADFSDYAEYITAVADWKAEVKAAEKAKETATAGADTAKQEAARLQQAEAAMLEQNWQLQAQEAITRYADFQEIVAQPGLFPKGSNLVAMVQSSDVAADLAYRLASDKALHDRILKAHPLDAAREIGRLEATIATPKPRTSTQAPAPITPVRGSARATLDPAKLSMEAYIEGRKSGKIR